MRIIIIHPRVEVRIPAAMRFLCLSALWFGGVFCTWGPAAKRLESMRAIRGRL